MRISSSNTQTSMCMICRDKNNTIILDRLNIIKNKLGKYKPENRHPSYLQWGIYPKCKYGMSCTKLNQYKTECDRKTKEIEPLIEMMLESNDISVYHNVMDLLKGYFPSIYRYVEINWHKNHKCD